MNLQPDALVRKENFSTEGGCLSKFELPKKAKLLSTASLELDGYQGDLVNCLIHILLAEAK